MSNEAAFRQARKVYEEILSGNFRAIRDDLESLFVWNDEYLRAVDEHKARPEDAERFIEQTHLLYAEQSGEGRGVGWWFGPSDEAKSVFEAASKRLDELKAWDIGTKLPHRKLTLESVEKYQKSWLDKEADIAHLGGYKNDVDSLAKEAAEKGFVIKGGPLPTIDVENGSSATQAAAAVAAAQKDASKALSGAASSYWDTVGAALAAIPLRYKLGAGALLLGVVGIAAYGNAKGRR